MILSNLVKSVIISIISLIVYVVVTDKLDKLDKKDNTLNYGIINQKDKNKEYMIIFGIIIVSSFIVINMSSNNTTELVPLKMSTIKEPLLNNKPPF